MAQFLTYTWTNGSTAPGSKVVPVGFQVAQATIYNQTNFGSTTGTDLKQALWLDTMPAGSGLVTTGASASYVTSGGITYMAEAVRTGAVITATGKATSGTITVDDASSFQIGDVIKAVGVADDASGTTWNGSFTLASIAGNVLTLTANTSAYAVYVGGGYVSIVTRVIDGSAKAWPVTNLATAGLLLGSDVVGAAGDVMHMTVVGKNPVT